MPRLARRPSTTGYYHVLARGHNRQAIFRDTDDYQQYLARLATLTARFPLRCHHGCLMPNHIHLLVSTETVEALTAALRRLQQAYQLHWRRRYSLVGHLWQGRFKSLPIHNSQWSCKNGPLWS